MVVHNISGLPLHAIKNHFTINTRTCSGKHRDKHNAPRNDHIQRQTGKLPLYCLKLKLTNLAAAFQHMKVNLNTPANTIPLSNNFCLTEC